MLNPQDKQDIEKGDSYGSIHGSVHSKSLASSGITDDSRSVSGTAREESHEDAGFEWKSQFQNAMYFLAYTSSWTSFNPFDMHEKIFYYTEKVNILQILVLYLFFGNPLVFVQTFIGQYTKKGVLVLGEMMPIANGIGYLVLCNMLVDAISNLRVCTIVVFYLFVSLTNHPTPSWMLCLENNFRYGALCVGLKELDDCVSCTSPNAKEAGPCYLRGHQVFSAHLFMRFVTLPMLDKPDSFYPDSRLCLHLVLVIVLLFISISRNIKDLDGPIRIWNIFTVVSLVTLIIVVLFTSRRANGFVAFFTMTVKSFFSLPTWIQALRNVVIHLRLSEGGHILFGTFTPATVNSGVRSAYLCTFNFCLLCFFNFFYFILRENLLCVLNLDKLHLNRVASDVVLFSFYPQAIGILAAAPLWGTLYFLILFGITFQNLILQIVVMEYSLTCSIIKKDYYLYTRFIILICMALVVVLLFTPTGLRAGAALFGFSAFYRLSILLLIFLAIMVYGFQKLIDDIHFLLRHPPLTYYRMSWIISVIFLGIAVFYFFTSMNAGAGSLFMNIVLVSTVLCLIFGLSIKFVTYLRAKDLTSLLRPSETYGPPDVERRTNRRLFNPRFEVRFRRKVDKCSHRCLLGSVVLRRTLEKELALVSNVLLEIEDNETERKLKQDVVEALRNHRTIMSNFLARMSKSIQRG